jgi:hypothetical protein
VAKKPINKGLFDLRDPGLAGSRILQRAFAKSRARRKRYMAPHFFTLSRHACSMRYA